LKLFPRSIHAPQGMGLTSFLVAVCFWGSVGPGTVQAEADPALINHLREHVQALEMIGPRPPGSDAVFKAGQYFADQMQSIGFDVHKQDMMLPNQLPTANWVTDRLGLDDTIMLVCAHLDTVAGSPGANDDASAIAALIELGRFLSREKPSMDVRFIAFGAEEAWAKHENHEYSAHKYLESLPATETCRIEGAIYLDQIGRGNRLVIQRPFKRDPSLARRLAAVSYQILKQPKKYSTLWTLQMSPFDQYVIPVAWVQWKRHQDTHTPRDTSQRINYERIAQTVDVLRHFLEIREVQTSTN